MKLPRSFKNLTSIIGALIALISFAIILVLFIVSSLWLEKGSYLGIFIYIVMPVFLVIGLILIPIGALSHRKKTDKEPSKEWPTIDFNRPSVQNASVIFLIGTISFLVLTSIGSFEAFHLTESNEFCGKLCHKVMEPEYTTYHNSAHERVKCVECHVGSGASWYVRSKVSGLYQVYAVLSNNYPKPISTPIKDLRPARETCEECHWPQKFYDRKIKNKVSYLADEQSTQWNIQMQMKTSSSLGNGGNLEKGIHWHINPDVKIEYIASTTDRETIPWVKFTNKKTGESKIFEDSQNKLMPEQFDTLEIRTMDCLDCHNRPSHNFGVPQNFIDKKLTSGELSRELPDIKIVAMDILNQDYVSTDSAKLAIEKQVREYYELMYPETLQQNEQGIKTAISAIQNAYSQNIFPEMKVKWSSYLNHLGHLESEGCYRCHNDRHSTESGEVISRDCNQCHDIVAQGQPDEMQISTIYSPIEFKHPIDINEAWRETHCSECHRQLY